MISKERRRCFGLCKAQWRHTKVRLDSLEPPIILIVHYKTFHFPLFKHAFSLKGATIITASEPKTFLHFSCFQASHSFGSWEYFRGADQLNEPSWQIQIHCSSSSKRRGRFCPCVGWQPHAKDPTLELSWHEQNTHTQRKASACPKLIGPKAQRLKYSETKPGLNCIKCFAGAPAEFLFRDIWVNYNCSSSDMNRLQPCSLLHNVHTLKHALIILVISRPSVLIPAHSNSEQSNVKQSVSELFRGWIFKKDCANGDERSCHWRWQEQDAVQSKWNTPAKQTHMPLLQHAARAQKPSQSHAPREAENMHGTWTLAKHCELDWFGCK